MDSPFILFGFILFFSISILSVYLEEESDPASLCRKKLNETCIRQNECCSSSSDCCTNFCYKLPWADNGQCEDVLEKFLTSTDSEQGSYPEDSQIFKLANIDNCKPLEDNTCTHHDECCSRNCFKEHDWEMGICKKTLSNAIKYERSGLCSYYEGGGTTASGEPFRSWAMTAAHRTLPFNTTLLVTTRSGRSVVVRVNDRGPYVDGRILDLSRGAAKHLGTTHVGVAPCVIKVLKIGGVSDKDGGDGGSSSGGGGGRRCKKNWNNTCTTNDECCSRNCCRQPKWAQGVCKPANR